MIRYLAILVFAPMTAFAEIPLYPPAEYDRPYTAGEHIVYVVPLRKVKQLCQENLNILIRHAVEGCRWNAGTTCYNVVAKNPKRAQSVDGLMRHERAHCNGWKH